MLVEEPPERLSGGSDSTIMSTSTTMSSGTSATAFSEGPIDWSSRLHSQPFLESSSPTIPDEYLTQDLSWNNPELRPNEDTRPPRGLPALQLPRPMQQPPIQAPLPQPAQAFPQPSNFPSSSRGQPTNWNADRSLERRPQAPSSNATFTPSVWSPKPMNARPAFQPIPSLPSSPPPNVVDQISPSLRSPARLSNDSTSSKSSGQRSRETPRTSHNSNPDAISETTPLLPQRHHSAGSYHSGEVMSPIGSPGALRLSSSSSSGMQNTNAQGALRRYWMSMDPSEPMLASQQPLVYEVKNNGSVVLFTTDSVTMMCPYEKKPVITMYQSSPGLLAYGVSLMTCVIGVGCCFFVPCCAESMRSHVHRCSSCNRILAYVELN